MKGDPIWAENYQRSLRLLAATYRRNRALLDRENPMHPDHVFRSNQELTAFWEQLEVASARRML